MNQVFFDAEVPVIAEVDVLVCGGGPAGTGAAAAAARQGAETLLVERTGCLGGAGTNSLVGIWLGSYSRDGAYPVVGGVFTEIVNAMIAEGAASPAGQDPPGSRHIGFAEWHSRTIPFEFEVCKRICESVVLEAGARLRYFTWVVGPRKTGDRIEGVFVHSKNGLEFIRAKTVIDTTGDADIAYRAGCPFDKGRAEDGLMSPASILFKVEDVDYQTFEDYCRSTGDVRLRDIVAKIKAKGEWPFPFEIIIALEMLHRGNYIVNTLRQVGIDGTDADSLTHGMVDGRRQAKQLFDLMRRYVPGFAGARLTRTAPVIGIRDTRRIVGDYRITVNDLVESRSFDDTIALSGYQWDMADPKEPSRQEMHGTETRQPYAEIPYRSLLPQGVDNLIVAGRSLSTEWQALGPLRIMPACFAMGQAAGTAAAMAVETNVGMRDVDVAMLHASLVDQGAILAPG